MNISDIFDMPSSSAHFCSFLISRIVRWSGGFADNHPEADTGLTSNELTRDESYTERYSLELQLQLPRNKITKFRG